MRSNHISTVMPALVTGILVLLAAVQRERRGWPGRSPAMTPEKWCDIMETRFS
jgi:hypothetical protein